MFLIQYAKGMFINTDRIGIVTFIDGKVKFYATCDDSDHGFIVGEEFAAAFINHLQVLNGNISNIEAAYNEDEVKKLLAERKEYLANKVLDASDRKLLDRLLAERDEAQSDNESLEDKLQEQMNLVGSLLVEREQWMKQEPVAYEHTFAISDNGTKFKIYTSKKEHQEAESSCPVFAHPLPAQQAPEGLAESEFEKYFEQIGVDVWEDHPVSQAYIDGFNRAIELSAATKPGDK